MFHCERAAWMMHGAAGTRRRTCKAKFMLHCSIVFNMLRSAIREASLSVQLYQFDSINASAPQL
jgi:hypothetical protein